MDLVGHQDPLKLSLLGLRQVFLLPHFALKNPSPNMSKFVGPKILAKDI